MQVVTEFASANVSSAWPGGASRVGQTMKLLRDFVGFFEK
jgi:hypothetical protein